MIPHLRTYFNRQFSQDKYQALLDEIVATYNHMPPFKIAETPVFFDNNIKARLFEAVEEINDVICQPNFKELSHTALLAGQTVPNEDEHTLFLQMDFGICKDQNEELIPQLIEVQGFPSLYFYQNLVGNLYQKYYNLPENYTHLFGGLDARSYMELLRKNIIGNTNPKQVVLLEVEPKKQVTQIDFLVAQKELGLAVKCVSEIKKVGNDLFYKDDNGKLIQIEKIFNRVIFDELIKRDDLQREFYFTQDANVEWVGHPNWFFRISKHTIPFLDSIYVPKTYFLSELNSIPDNLGDYVLKPLYSFAGTGVLININKFDIEAIEDPENYILQKKVKYEPIIETLDEKAKCEVRMLMIWEHGEKRPRIINNLVRLSKAEMIGVRYNKGKSWVGGSVGLFEKP